MRCAAEPEQNAQALSRELSEGTPDAVVALDGSRVVGWCRLRPSETMGKLLDGRLYRGLACLGENRERVWILSCFLVDPAWRRRAVGRALLRGAIERALELGARRIEAFPCGANDVSDEQQWMGPLSMYLEQGFTVVHDFGPYPVLRLEISGELGVGGKFS
jgi:GNAT superfamily N-acetyltransferase